MNPLLTNGGFEVVARARTDHGIQQLRVRLREELDLQPLRVGVARQAGEETDTGCDYEYTDWAQVDRYATRLSAI